MPDRVKPSFVIFDIEHSDAHGCQSARMSKITNDDLTWSGAGCFIAVAIWHSGFDAKGFDAVEFVRASAMISSHILV